ncbi:MATE family efflux transporter [Pediococcus ethanolidurans]|uniref:Multidrug export protein MepA n=1 Tax=Pediococcus ethanolidurans TaxID=319653 RepID=A0A0R2JY45_9LACO|nr:MATE family efflux transporter [Pediococcus ethanolidurans]KRN82120.1 Na+ driven multidrug efflux pump [Pediococcus ethanolidurans]GEN95477.1 MATE family efflux transporter [Pediococcus ethanolidurans]SER72829.1 putative efflux protein, MATE family [Pediococcus ethanolidurans]
MNLDYLFAHAPIPKVYMKLALPVVLGMVASMIYNLADTFFVAQTGNADLVAGIALGTPLFSFMLAIGDIFGLGGSAAISRLLGKKMHVDSAHLSSFCFYSAIVFSLVLTLVMLVFERPILGLMGVTSQTYQYAADFYRMIALGSVFIIVSLVPGNIIRTEGLATKSMIATLSGTILTIVLDPIFLFSFHWGALGVGLANVIGYVVNTSLLVIFMIKDCQILSLSIKKIYVSKKAIKDVLNIGIPASLTNFMQSFGIMLLNNYLAPYGANAIAAMGIVLKIYMVVMLIMVGFAFGAQPLIGYNYGSGDTDRFKAVVKFDFVIEVVYALICAVILMIFAPQLMALFMHNTAIIKMGTTMLRLLLATAPLTGAILVFTTIFQSAGKAMGALIMSISRQGIIFGISIVSLAALFGYTGVIIAQPIADILTFAVGYWLYKQILV